MNVFLNIQCSVYETCITVLYWYVHCASNMYLYSAYLLLKLCRCDGNVAKIITTMTHLPESFIVSINRFATFIIPFHVCYYESITLPISYVINVLCRLVAIRKKSLTRVQPDDQYRLANKSEVG